MLQLLFMNIYIYIYIKGKKEVKAIHLLSTASCELLNSGFVHAHAPRVSTGRGNQAVVRESCRLGGLIELALLTSTLLEVLEPTNR